MSLEPFREVLGDRSSVEVAQPTRWRATAARVLRSVAAASLVLAGTPVQAGEDSAEGQMTHAAAAGHHHAGASGGEAREVRLARHHLMLMASAGVTGDRTPILSAGLGYEFRLPIAADRVGIGGMVEFMVGTTVHPMLMAELALHPAAGLRVALAGGISHVHQSQDGSPPAMATLAIGRLSLGYDLHVGPVMVTPYANADLSSRWVVATSAGICVGLML